MNVPIRVNIGFQQRDRQVSQILYIDSFCRLPVTSAQCNIGTENFLEAGKIIIYDDVYSQGYAQNKKVFRALTKDDILQPKITNYEFRS